MKKITLYRPKESFNQYCSYRILVGGNVLTELGNGEEKVIELPNDQETGKLQAKIQWCGSEKLELATISDNQKLIVTGNKFLNKRLPLIGALFPITGVVILNSQNLLPKNIGIGFFLAIMAILILSITLWMNRWLKLEKEER